MKSNKKAGDFKILQEFTNLIKLPRWGRISVFSESAKRKYYPTQTVLHLKVRLRSFFGLDVQVGSRNSPEHLREVDAVRANPKKHCLPKRMTGKLFLSHKLAHVS